MPIKNITSNYSGRRKDISIMQYPDPTNIDPQDMTISFGNIGRFCAGVQKLIQRYTILLLTNLDSQTYYPDFGTSLISNLHGGVSAMDLIGVKQIFNNANYAAIEAIQAEQVYDQESPLDERIYSAELVEASVIGSAVYFSVKITTESSTAVDFVLPLPI
jgi:hypothetical protein